MAARSLSRMAGGAQRRLRLLPAGAHQSSGRTILHAMQEVTSRSRWPRRGVAADKSRRVGYDQCHQSLSRSRTTGWRPRRCATVVIGQTTCRFRAQQQECWFTTASEWSTLLIVIARFGQRSNDRRPSTSIRACAPRRKTRLAGSFPRVDHDGCAVRMGGANGGPRMPPHRSPLLARAIVARSRYAWPAIPDALYRPADLLARGRAWLRWWSAAQ